MSSETADRPGRLTRRIWLVIALALFVFLGANAHLLYVAISSTPDCVAHLKVAGEAGSGYRAARSSC